VVGGRRVYFTGKVNKKHLEINKKNIPRTQTMPDALFGPVIVVTTLPKPPQTFKT
jgi:hypothetical protein